MHNSESYVWTGQMKNLHPVLRRWTELMSKTTIEWAPDDCAWWYNERPAVGLLAAACWLENGMALEEYGDNNTSKGNPYAGRLDLFLSRNGIDYQVEAKHCWQHLTASTPKLRKQLLAVLNRAVDDVAKIPACDSRPVGVTFAVPYISSKHAPTTVVPALQRWQAMLDSLNIDLLAWSFPPVGWKMVYEGYVYPGVALIGKSAKYAA